MENDVHRTSPYSPASHIFIKSHGFTYINHKLSNLIGMALKKQIAASFSSLLILSLLHLI